MSCGTYKLSKNFLFLIMASSTQGQVASGIFAEYIGAEFKNVKFSHAPIRPSVQCHLILAFAIDYDISVDNPSPTNGVFDIFWDSHNLNPSQGSTIKLKHLNIKSHINMCN